MSGGNIDDASRKYQVENQIVNPTQDDVPRIRGAPGKNPVGFVEEQALGSQKDALS